MDADPHITPIEYVTADLPGIGGVLKQRPEDFLVEEIPLYEPSGAGEHFYLFVQKREMTTLELVGKIAKHFGVSRRAVGYAGLKDKHAITRQVLSIHMPGRKLDEFPLFEHHHATVLWAALHSNKLRRGHLKGNRFSIRVREVDATGAVGAKRVLDVLEAVGVANRVGEQRFGILKNNHLIGAAIIVGDHQRAIDLLVGPGDACGDNHAESRGLYAQGRYADAARLLPRGMRPERAVLSALARGMPADRAVRTIETSVLSFFFSAFQSAAFNDVLDTRITEGALGQLRDGDVAFLHGNRAQFDVDEQVMADPTTEGRLASFEISPSGPMWGAGMKRARGQTGDTELGALGTLGVSTEELDAFASQSMTSMSGDRRPLRVPLIDPEVEGGIDEHGHYVRCAFELPRGSFATVVMDEMMKSRRVAEAGA